MADRIRIVLIAGARPNFMKIASLHRAFMCYSDRICLSLVHTGQHYDQEMSKVFFENLGIPEPDIYLDVGSGTHTYQTATAMLRVERYLNSNHPDMVIVVGDVNSTLAAALTCAKMNIAVAHVEAGLRSFDFTMPEEINRILTDRISTFLFVSEPSGMDNLTREGIDSNRMHLVGNVMIDTLGFNIEKIKKHGTCSKFGLSPGRFRLFTLHRPSNVDSRQSLESVLSILSITTKDSKVVFPVHPRTMERIRSFGLENAFASLSNLITVAPLGYLDFMNLMYHSELVLTDSGGIQEETTFLGIPCITLRETTERPFTVTHGTNTVTGLDMKSIEQAVDRAASFDKSSYSPPSLWDGKASQRIADIVLRCLRE